MLELKIRRYRKSDLNEVKNLHVFALKKTGTYRGSGDWDEDLNNIEEVYLKGGEFIVGLVNDKIIAMGAIKKISDEVGEIKRMRTHPYFQRKGYGQLILDKLEQRAKKVGFRILQLDTTIKQVAAQRFYQQNKYVEIKRGYQGGFETIYYQKRLDD
jgi:ribosomal protein S18 acetylase RimI-like enzyme